jgi:hypothetical protein
MNILRNLIGTVALAVLLIAAAPTFANATIVTSTFSFSGE